MKKIFSKKNIIIIVSTFVFCILILQYVNILPKKFNDFRKIFFPHKGDFVKIGKITEPMYNHSSILLKDGRVVLLDYNNCPKDIYDPKTKKFKPTNMPCMNFPRYTSATKLDDDKILISGGQIGNGSIKNPSKTIKTTFIYDPNENVIKEGPNMNVARRHHSSVLLNDGRVLVTGGSFCVQEAEIFDPKTNSFKAIDNMPSPKSNHKMALMNDGRVIILGGYGGHYTCSNYNLKDDFRIFIYDPITNKFMNGGKISYKRGMPIIYVLKNNKILITSKVNQPEIEEYDPETRKIKTVGIRVSKAIMPAQAKLKDDKILYIAGCSGVSIGRKCYKTSEIFDPETGLFESGEKLNYMRSCHNAILLKDGNVLITGSEGTLKTSELFINN